MRTLFAFLRRLFRSSARHGRAGERPLPESRSDANSPDNPHLASGLMNSARGAPAEAAADFARAIEQDPENAAAYTTRAITSDGLGLFKEAIADESRAPQLQPDSLAIYLNGGLMRHRQGSEESGPVYWDRAVELGPESATGMYNRGRQGQVWARRSGRNRRRTLAGSSSLRDGIPPAINV